ncbi:MAG: rRNA maturation RNase YbeY [Bernardetiaceae bacterium]
MIQFFNEDVDFDLPQEAQIARQLDLLCQEQQRPIGQLNYIFCSDEFLFSLNQEYLDHDTYTDIITFDQSEDGHTIEGDVFISVERVAENAEHFGVNFEREMARVIVHGLLHLLGLSDKTPQDEAEMRAAEDDFLKKLL